MELQISIKDEKADLFLQILREFKDDMVKKIKILDSNYVDDEEQKEIEKILDSISKEDREIAFSKTITIEV